MPSSIVLAATSVAFVFFLAVGAAEAQRAEPTSTNTPIRTSAAGAVPRCITAAGLDRILTERNPGLERKFVGIAAHYQRHGEAYGVRWDWAFYQMLLETNYLKFMRRPGKPGDVRPRQNNFAGIGATGRGVPGESYPDVPTGVLVHIQHLVAYSGELVPDAFSPRTRENQQMIAARSRKLARPVTYRDLTNRWAMDGRYARSLEAIADRVHEALCGENAVPAPVVAARSLPSARGASAPPVAGQQRPPATLAATPSAKPDAPSSCRVFSASYGGRKAMLIRQDRTEGVKLTALEVLDGFEGELARSFIAAHAPGGRTVAEFENQRKALDAAFALCRVGAPQSSNRGATLR